MREYLHRFADSRACGDNVLDNYDFLTCGGNVAYEYAALAVVLSFLSVEEEGNVEVAFGKSDCRGNRERDALVCGTVENRLLCAELLEVSLSVEFAELCNVLARLYHTCVNEIGNLSAALCGEVAKLKDSCALKELYKFSLIAFHFKILTKYLNFVTRCAPYWGRLALHPYRDGSVGFYPEPPSLRKLLFAYQPTNSAMQRS